jgi:hypothetical protein
MKNRIILLALVSVVFFSCKKEEKQQSTDEMKSEVPQVGQPATEECYEYVQGKDTIQAKFLVQNMTVSGDLNYKLFEKDKNSGKITGTISGDTLLADYTFMSEGKESVRQVAFLRKNKTLMEGYGESEEKEGKTVFKETKKLNFASSIILNEIPCK